MSKQDGHWNLGCLISKPQLALPPSLGRKPLKERGIKFPGWRPGTYKKNHPRDPLAGKLTRLDKASPFPGGRALVNFIGPPLMTPRHNLWASKPLR